MRVAPLVGIPALLREFGADPEAVFASCGVDYRILGDPDNPIPYAAGGRLLSRSVAVTACPHFGLLLGQKGALPRWAFSDTSRCTRRTRVPP